ncbi:tetraspanin-33 [Schistosoma bovis]|uniref:Tetraspanin-33 n=1 Tax=Schistosoma bovis TaxID=6184 RepID=A0A430QES8_SCHBO|nr:tetraspanin-33 [Schistosoma bovis]
MFYFQAVGALFLVFGVIAFSESEGIPWKSKTIALHWLFNLTLNCCGPKSYLDWTANRYFSCDKSNISPEACGVPYSCCRQMNDISVNIINTSCGFGVQKLTTAEANRMVWTTGCVHALISAVENNIVYFAYGFVSVAVFQLIAILLAKTLHTQINDQLRLVHQENNYL